MPASGPLPVLVAFYVVSGAAALMLEVAWARLLGLHLGHTTGATSTVLAAFMGGLALGALVGGRLAARVDRGTALRMFAAAEGTVAVSALLIPTMLRAGDPLLAWGYADGAGGAGFAVLRVIVCVAVLLLPTTAMGAGYPLLVRAAGPGSPAGRVSGWLYAGNTAGASVGAVLGGFVLLPAWGLRGSTWVAAALDVGVALVAWSAGRRLARVTGEGEVRRHVTPGDPAPGPLVAALMAAALVGAVSMGAQVVWTRVLALVVGPTTYAFSAVLGVWIGATAVGALVGTRLARQRGVEVWLAATAGGIVLSLGLGMASVDGLVLAAGRAAAADVTADLVVTRPLTAALRLVGPLSLCLGAAFPLLLALARADADPRRLAWIYGSNTLGAIAGALLAGFALVPWWGLQPTLYVMAAGATLVAATSLAVARPSRVVVVGALVVAVGLGLALARAQWTPALLASGAYRYVPAGARDDVETALLAGELLYLRDGASATVAVRRLAGTTSLVIDGKPDASDAGDMLTQKLLGHLPLLLHERPRIVGVIGLGSGVTAGAVLQHPVDVVDVVEIAPEVVEASSAFAGVHGRALSDPRVRLRVTDARSHLRLSRTTYDVVISEPSNPWMAGVAALFTREFMASVRSRLRPGGLFCQWAHTYDMSEADLRSILATFQAVFPQGSVWLVGEADLLLVGGVDAAPDPERLGAALGRPGVLDDLRRVGVSQAGDLSGLRLADAAGLARLAAGARAQDDDRLALEFSAPRSLALRSGRDNLTWLRVATAPIALSPAAWGSRGRMLARAEAWGLAYEALVQAVRGGEHDEPTLDAFLRAAGGAGHLEGATEVLRALVASTSAPSPADSARRAALARLLAARGDVRAALAAVRPLPTPDPIRLRAGAAIIADLGDAETLARVVADLRQVTPDHVDTWYFDATTAFLRGDLAGAERIAQAAAARFPQDARLQNLLGATWATQSRRPEAAAAFARALALDPREAGTYLNSARMAEADGRRQDAARRYAEALALDPGNAAALEGLRRTRSGA